MKITTLIENNPGENKKLKYEHGLSMFIESENCNILFDSGQSGDIVENAKVLNVDLTKTDIIILSHGHYDHCGGIRKLLETYEIKPKFIVGKNFFENSHKYRNLKSEEKVQGCENEYKYIGIDFDRKYLEDKDIEITEGLGDGVLKISDDISVFSDFGRFYDFEKVNENMKYLKDEKYIVDDFEDEICIGIKKAEGIIVLLGCAHPGFLNIVKTIEKRTNEKIYGIIGGTHLKSADDERINKSIEVLKDMDIKILGLSHCTGKRAEEILKDNFNNLFYNKTGKILEV